MLPQRHHGGEDDEERPRLDGTRRRQVVPVAGHGAASGATVGAVSVSKRKMRGLPNRNEGGRQRHQTMDEVMSGQLRAGDVVGGEEIAPTRNEPPPTSTAGTGLLTPRQPSMMAASQNSRSTVMNGNWRPAIWPMGQGIHARNRPADDQNAHGAEGHGAVLAIRHRLAAYSGSKPEPTSKAAVMATGAPKPAALQERAEAKATGSAAAAGRA